MYCKMIYMKKIISVLFTLVLGISLYAQSADVITDILESEEATFGQVCYLAAVQKNLINENDSYENAVQALYDNGVIPDFEDPMASIPLIDIVYIYSRLWPIEGGVMYKLTKGSPRYTFKQFQSDGILNSKQDPSDIVTGAKALSIYTSCVNKYSGFDMRSVSMEVE